MSEPGPSQSRRILTTVSYDALHFTSITSSVEIPDCQLTPKQMMGMTETFPHNIPQLSLFV